jgi:hypothetical protein
MPFLDQPQCGLTSGNIRAHDGRLFLHCSGRCPRRVLPNLDEQSIIRAPQLGAGLWLYRDEAGFGASGYLAGLYSATHDLFQI